jgi:hypothetical protein
MTALQVIIKEAKAIRSKNPKMEWKKAVAQASAIYAKMHKGISPVGKKHAVKKKAAKKKAVKKTVKIKKRVVKKIASKKKPSEKAVLKSIKHAVSVQKAHMSGIGALSSHVIHEVKEAHDKLIKWQKVLLALEKEKTMVSKGMKPVVNMDIKRAKEAIKEQKTHIAQLKKHIK